MGDWSSGDWQAGKVVACDGGPSHGITNIHVIVRCACGAAFMSTDAGIALGMAGQHQNTTEGVSDAGDATGTTD